MTERKRPDWNEYFSKIVWLTKDRSPCHRLQVGCLLVKDNRIISQGYNGFLSSSHCSTWPPSNHAAHHAPETPKVPRRAIYRKLDYR